jgi:hypothetical protein
MECQRRPGARPGRLFIQLVRLNVAGRGTEHAESAYSGCQCALDECSDATQAFSMLGGKHRAERWSDRRYVIEDVCEIGDVAAMGSLSVRLP